MEQNLADLLGAAISNSYGAYYASVLAELASRNRATATNLIRALPQYNSNDVRLALVTLIQQNLVRYHADKDTGTTSYEPNWENAYNFTCRAPTLYKFVEGRFDTQVAKVFDFVSRSGLARVGDLVEEFIPKVPEDKVDSNGTGTNGHTEEKEFAQKQAEQKVFDETYGALNLLLGSSYLMPIKHERQFWPDYDRKQEAVTEIVAAKFPGGMATTKRDKDTVEEESNRLLRRWREEERTSADQMRTNGSKRERSPDYDDDARQSKRHRTNGQKSNGIDGQVHPWVSTNPEPLDRDLFITVNFDKCNVGLRNKQFVKFSERYISYTTAKVFDAMLRVLEPNMRRCHDPLDMRQAPERDFSGDQPSKPLDQDLGMSDPVTPRQIAQLLDPDINLDDGLPTNPDVVDSIEHTNGINGHGASNGDIMGHARLKKIEQHLSILVCDARGFVYLREHEYTVPFHALTQRLIEYELENIITHSLGMLPARIVRILKFYGNMEVWSIATRAMVLQDSARKALIQLQQAGWVDVMELPKNARREVMRSNWVHQYDVLRAREKVLSDCYFTLARLFMRIRVEKSKIQRTIDKSLRSDVIGNEEKYLSTEDKRVLARFGKQEELVFKQVARIDEIVALMRDFSKMEYPHRLWDLGWVDWRRLSSHDATPKYEPGSSEDEVEGDYGDD